MVSCIKPRLVGYGSKKYISVSADAPSDAGIEAIIKPYRDPMNKVMQEIICYSDTPAVRELPEGSLGNLITDVLRDECSRQSQIPIDVCFMNQGGLRIDWPKGGITRSMVFEIMPFENKLQLVEMDSLQLANLLVLIAQRGGAPISGLKMKIKDGKLEGWNLDNVSKKKTYTLLTSDYLINGGDSYTISFERILWQGPRVRDAIELGIKNINASGQILKPRKDGRIELYTSP
jgi:2',3'-cyclic-nucleotide 2'-phosphodiesterase (5'-nucleotidase family)